LLCLVSFREYVCGSGRISILEKWKMERLPNRTDGPWTRTPSYVAFDGNGLGLVGRIKLAFLRGFGYSEAPSRALNGDIVF
jgi:hypothetical protein